MMCMSCLTQHMSGSFMMHVFEEIVTKIGVHLVVGLGSRKERPVVNEYHLECHQLACLSLAGFMLENLRFMQEDVQENTCGKFAGIISVFH